MITVAVASYNHRPYVQECLRSIAGQSYPDIELCWIDDHSTDGTFDELEALTRASSMRARFSRITIKRNGTNRGAPFSLNLAARLGSGKLISFMNSDDYYHIDRLRSCANKYNGQRFFMWFSNVLPVDESGKPILTDPVGEKIAFDAEILLATFKTASRALLSRQIASSTGNFVVSRHVFDAVGGFQNLKYCHDWMFALRVSRYCEPIFDSRRLYYYRLHPSNTFRSLANVAEEETRAVLTDFFEAVALAPAENPNSPCPRLQPAGFWELVEATNTKHVADRVFFPYTRATRLLSWRAEQ